MSWAHWDSYNLGLGASITRGTQIFIDGYGKRFRGDRYHEAKQNDADVSNKYGDALASPCPRYDIAEPNSCRCDNGKVHSLPNRKLFTLGERNSKKNNEKGLSYQQPAENEAIMEEVTGGRSQRSSNRRCESPCWSTLWALPLLFFAVSTLP